MSLNPVDVLLDLDGDLLTGVISALIFLEELGVPVPFAPGDIMLIIGGIAIASGTVQASIFVPAVILASISGALAGREIFALIGRPALLRAADALHFRPAVDRVGGMLQRQGWRAILLGRLIPGLRINTTQVAGATGLSRRSFAAGLIPAVIVYVAIFTGIGFVFGLPIIDLFHNAQRRLFVIVVSALLVVAFLVSLRLLYRRGAFATLQPIVIGAPRDIADAVERRLAWHGAVGVRWREFPLVRRVLAAVIDVALIVGATIFVVTVLANFSDSEVVLDPQGFAALLLMTLVYRIGMEWGWGKTLGKAVMGLRVYGTEGPKARWWQIVLRNLIAVVVVLWPVDAILMFRSQTRQRIGDRLSRTVVRRIAVQAR
jgi:membrane-associated protein